ncbi:MAG: UbiA family prenyltransferase [Gemmataceae bacterium]
MNPLARLVRLPALPTAAADVVMAALAVGALPAKVPQFVLLLAGSAGLYLGGMALNDWFDQDEDRRDRPDRPIPSGEVSSRSAMLVGFGLLASGVVLSSLAASPAVAVALAAMIVLYDGYAKQTWLGPLVMGGCRALHVLLGASLSGDPMKAPGPHLALVVGLYIVGVTWFARGEAGRSRRGELTAAAGVVLMALALALAVPAPLAENTASPVFPYLLVGLGFLVGVPAWRAIEEPVPGRVQAAVGRMLMGLIVLDAALATAVAGSAGLVILALLVPGLLLMRARRLYAT